MILDFAEPKVAIVDDRPDEVTGILEALQQRSLGYKFYNAAIGEDHQPDSPLESIETVFLDLHFGESMKEFDPYLPANWIHHIIPKGKNYQLIIWTKDRSKSEEVLKILNRFNNQPAFYYTAQKSDYQEAEGYNIDKLFQEINQEFSNNDRVNDLQVKGEIIAVEEDYVLINCLLSTEKPAFQVRRFDKELLDGVVSLEVGSYVTITIKTEPGERTFKFSQNHADLSEMFKPVDFFDQFKNSPFSGNE